MSLQGKPHEPFGMGNIEPTARSVARRIGRETGLGLVALEGHRVAVRRNPTALATGGQLIAYDGWKIDREQGIFCHGGRGSFAPQQVRRFDNRILPRANELCQPWRTALSTAGWEPSGRTPATSWEDSCFQKFVKLTLMVGLCCSSELARQPDHSIATVKQIPMADDLAQELSDEMGWNYTGEALSIVYSAIHSTDPTRLHCHMKRRFTNTKPSSALRILASHPWARVYTANIDDCFETAVRLSRNQQIHICTINSPLEELDPIFQSLQLIKLNGIAEKPEDGFIFSPQEYGEGSSRLPAWYRELAQDYSSYTFVFLGSRLNEPLLQHAIAEMRQDIHRSPLPGFVITPSASDIEKHHLKGLRLSHIRGSVADFASWMRKEIAEVPTGWDLALARRPELRNLGDALSDSQKRALNSVTLVSADTLPRTLPARDAGPIRNFYRGFKPRWNDILDNVPANVSFIAGFTAELQKKHETGHCFALVGQAGSGKSTAMMTVALHLSQTETFPVYFLRDPVGDIGNVIRALEELNGDKYYLFIDKIDSMHKSVADSIESSRMKNGCIVFSERINIWTRRIRQVLGPYTSGLFAVKRISWDDAKSILVKIEKFGPWTRLQGMSVSDRMKEVFDRADRQLLIGLLEATTGMGFTQIIRRDFADIGDDEHKRFLVLVGLASIHRARISPSIVGRALVNMGVVKDVNRLISEVEGIVVSQGRQPSGAPFGLC